ncbi:craniofacial development 2-like, partial [Brachionus plicatilis]
KAVPSLDESFVISSGLNDKDLILGRDILKKYGVVIDNSSDSFMIDREPNENHVDSWSEFGVKEVVFTPQTEENGVYWSHCLSKSDDKGTKVKDYVGYTSENFEIVDENNQLKGVGYTEKVVRNSGSLLKRWISDKTWALIAERGEIKAKMLQAKSNRIREKLEASYGIKNRLVKKGARRDKRNYINQCASEAEEASSKGDLH